VCEAVAFAHAAGVVHRDLKPQNVMLGPFGEVLVLDWGAAKVRGEAAPVATTDASGGPSLRASDSADTAPGTVIGTPGYMAPEQLTGGTTVDERTDVYGLGGILHFLLSGAHPSATDAGEGGEDLPGALRAIRGRARAAEPKDRYRSASELAADISNYLDALPVAAHRERVFERARRIAARHRTALLLVLAYLVMRLALLIFA
jgi:serine/threonine-protein kinase